MQGWLQFGPSRAGNFRAVNQQRRGRIDPGLAIVIGVFGNGGGPRKATRDDLTNVDTSGNKDYLQEAGIALGSPGAETHGGGDVYLFATGAGSTVFKGTIDNTKVNTLVKTAFGF